MMFGIDIGGFHIKGTAVNTPGLTATSVFMPFLEKRNIVEKLDTFVTDPDLVVITQTVSANRRLFSSLKEGTHFIVDITSTLFGEKARYVGLPCRLYTAEEARRNYLNVACRNWVATCYVASSYLNLFENGVVIDCGTTSTDIVPVISGTPITLDDDDQAYTRLRTGELLWSGLYNTHIGSVWNTVVLDNKEFTMKSSMRTMSYDVYIVLELIKPEELIAVYRDVAHDVSLISYESSVDKILDLIAADREVLTVNDAKKIAHYLAEKQKEKTRKAIKQVLSGVKEKYNITMETVGVAGAGKDIILREALKDFDLDILDIEQAFSEQVGAGVEWNCETALGCALMGLES